MHSLIHLTTDRNVDRTVVKCPCKTPPIYMWISFLSDFKIHLTALIEFFLRLPLELWFCNLVQSFTTTTKHQPTKRRKGITISK